MKVQCPNCGARIYKVQAEYDQEMFYINWFHQYGDFCRDIIYPEYHIEYKDSLYLKTLKDMFGIVYDEKNSIRQPIALEDHSSKE